LRITDSYRRLNSDLHLTDSSFATSGHKWAADVKHLMSILGVESVLDYGAGRCTLMQAINPNIAWENYDPAVPGLDEEPRAAELVVCTDVLEHVEPACLEDVLDHIHSLTGRAVFLRIATHPSTKTLADGRNAHLIQEPFEWWFDALKRHFATRYIEVSPVKVKFYGVPR
jgi:hypothetical protein